MRSGKENGILLPTATGALGQALVYNGSGALAWSDGINNAVTINTTQTVTGAKTFSAATTTFGAAAASSKLTTPGNALVFEQTGGTFGTTRLSITNESGSNGAIFEQVGTTADVVDFGFKTTTGQGNVRYERRTASFLDSTNTAFEFQIGTAGAAQLVVGDTSVTVKAANLKVGTNSVYHVGNIPGADTQLLYNGATGIGAATNVIVENNYLKLLTGLPTIAAVSGGVVLGSKDLAGRVMPAFVGIYGLDTTVQPHMGRNRIYTISPNVGAATVSVNGGLPAPTVSGATARTPAATSLQTSIVRVGFVSTATAGTLAYMRGSSLMWWRGNAAGLGGFHMTVTFQIPDTTAVAGKRMFIGLYGTAANPTNVEPTSLFNLIGIGKVSTSNNLCIISNAASGTGTATDLGTGFPATGTTATPVYMFTLFQPPGGGTPNYRLDRLDTNTLVSGTITATLPVTTAFMTQTMWVTNNATAAVCGFDFSNFYLETDQ